MEQILIKVANCQHLMVMQRILQAGGKKGPSLLFERLTSIQNHYLGPEKCLDKEDLIAIILDVATEEYRTILTIERKIKEIF
jgi:hypothetical protein